jgi:hypothetical protein
MLAATAAKNIFRLRAQFIMVKVGFTYAEKNESRYPTPQLVRDIRKDTGAKVETPSAKVEKS